MENKTKVWKYNCRHVGRWHCRCMIDREYPDKADKEDFKGCSCSCYYALDCHDHKCLCAKDKCRCGAKECNPKKKRKIYRFKDFINEQKNCKWCKMPIHKDINGRWEHDHNGMFNCDGKEGVATSWHVAKPDPLLHSINAVGSEGAN